jgi:DNA-binding NtrC family response regulator
MPTILVVDDEPAQCKSLTMGLLKHGYRVIEAQDGKTALDRLIYAGGGINLVVTDQSMPGTKGIELLRTIRDRFGALPVILMTAYGDKALINEAMHHQCNGYIEKPFPIAELLREIERILAVKEQKTKFNG